MPGLGQKAGWPDNFTLLFFTAAGVAFLASGLSSRLQECHSSAERPVTRQFFAPEALLPMVVQLCMYLTFTSYTTFLPLYARTFGLDNAGYLYSSYALMLVLTRMLSARLGDRYGRTAVIVPGLILALIAQLVFAFAWGVHALYVGVGVYAMGIGLAQPGLGALMIDRLTPERRGLGMATFAQGLDLGMGLGGVLMGGIASQAGFTPMYVCGSGCLGRGLGHFPVRLSAPKGSRSGHGAGRSAHGRYCQPGRFSMYVCGSGCLAVLGHFPVRLPLFLKRKESAPCNLPVPPPAC